MKRLIGFFVILLLNYTGISLAYGPHDPNCTGCHSLHNAKAPKIIAVEPYTKEVNPITKKKPTGIASLCLGCHNPDLGIKPILLSHSHPVEVTPSKKVKVPKSLLRDGKVTCSSCHDPHPSNPNYKYLIVDTKNGTELANLCGKCHGDKVEKKGRKK